MPESAPAEPPSRWTIVNDYSKTVVTLGAALLGFIAAFAEKLGTTDASAIGRRASIGAILFSLLAIAFALLVPGRMDRYLRICTAGDPAVGGTATQEQWTITRPTAVWWCKAWANLSYIALFFAALALAGVALTRLSSDQKKNETIALLEADRLLRTFSGIDKPKLQTQSITYDSRTDSFEVLVLEQSEPAHFKVNVPRRDAPCTLQRLP
jgi:hypothetical protein